MITGKTSELSSQVEAGKRISLSFYYHNKKIINFLNSLFTKILSRNNQLFLQSTLITIIRELVVNAVKANSKRLYFQGTSFDINDSGQYREGMENFKNYIVKNQVKCEEDLKNSKYRIKLNVDKNDTGMMIEVSNNAPILPEEIERINDRMSKAKKFNDFSEIYAEVLDESEGEGLGIMLTLLFLRNSGIGEDSLKIRREGDETVSSLFVPLELQPIEIKTRIQKQITDEVNDLPAFPENIVELQKMCKNPDVPIKKIGDRILMDPYITTAVLKLANSAGFITRTRTESIPDAVKKIGMKNLYAILTATSARKIMEEKYSKFSQIWNHCIKVATYSKIIATKFKMQKLIDIVFLAGLLHDLGKIILLSTNTDLSEWISNITRKKELRTSTVIEEVSIGISHSEIGEMIAKKWNLPEYICNTILNHHSPLSVDEIYKDIVFVVYLANQLCGIEERKYLYEYLEEDVVIKFDITDEEKFGKFHQEIKDQFVQQGDMM